MALLTPQQAKITGTVVTYAAASAGGDTVRPGERTELRVRNGGTAAITVTIVTPNQTKYGQPDPDIPVAVAAGAEVAIGPIPSDLADPTSGAVGITYSAAAGVTVAAVSV